MNKALIILLVISLIGNLLGLYVVKKYLGAKKAISYVRRDLKKSQDLNEKLTEALDEVSSAKMVFLHHSVGKNILYQGGLLDSLAKIGISVKGATYGDEIGENTDIPDWPGKFKNDLDRIFAFKAHPNRYYTNGKSNDIIMFKSCFPNSDIRSDGTPPGDPSSRGKTLANYKAVFLSIKDEMAKHKDKLFIYITSPPLVPERTTSANAKRDREFNYWLKNKFVPEYNRETGLDNFLVFDLFDVLAGPDNFLKKEYRSGKSGDSHPNAEANRVVARKFMEFFRPVWEKRRPDKS